MIKTKLTKAQKLEVTRRVLELKEKLPLYYKIVLNEVEIDTKTVWPGLKLRDQKKFIAESKRQLALKSEVLWEYASFPTWIQKRFQRRIQWLAEDIATTVGMKVERVLKEYRFQETYEK